MGDRVGQMWHAAGMTRRAAAGEARHREIETAPKEMHRARLAEKAGAELFEDAVAVDEDLQETSDGLGVVGGMRAVQREPHRIGQFVWHLVYGNSNAEFGKRGKCGGVEAGDRMTRQRKVPMRAVAGRDAQAMVDEIEIDLEGSRTVRHRRRRQSARRDIER